MKVSLLLLSQEERVKKPSEVIHNNKRKTEIGRSLIQEFLQ